MYRRFFKLASFASILAAILFLTTMATTEAAEGPIKSEDLPASLKDWQDWVLFGREAEQCAFMNGNLGQRPCLWPSRLSLNIESKGASFRLEARAEIATTVVLPGDTAHWPLTVQVDGQPAVVIERGGEPTLQLKPGQHTVSGNFLWSRQPSSLKVPANVALIALSYQNRAVSSPRFDEAGQLLLGNDGPSDTQRDSENNPDAAAHESLDLKVFRKLDDDIPLRLVTSLDLIVSGQNRDVVLGPILPAGFSIIRIISPLPAQLTSSNEAHAQLRLALRPGRWRVDIEAIHEGQQSNPTSITRPTPGDPWPSQEIWVYAAHTDLRAASIGGKGVVDVDPQQTQLPDDWRNLPTYQVDADAELTITERERGLVNDANDGRSSSGTPDSLNLVRDIWVDFDGTGYTLRDHLAGQLNRHSRLEMLAPLELARARVNGQEQMISKIGDESGGIEIRQQNVNLEAELRLQREGARHWRIPAVGWKQDLQSAKATLHIPPGWELLAVGGADAATSTWIRRWNLENLFLLLVVSVGFARLYGRMTGIICFVTLALTIVEPEAPRYLWLALLLGLALHKVLPSGRLTWVLKTYQGVVGLLLILIGFSFAAGQLRTAMYPLLEFPGRSLVDHSSDTSQYEDEQDGGSVANEAADEMLSKSNKSKAMMGSLRAVPAAAAPVAMESDQGRGAALNTVDPDARVQTGPGVPTWRWKRSEISWSGPVTHDQTLTLWLLPRWLTGLIHILRIGLILVFVMLIAGIDDIGDRQKWRNLGKRVQQFINVTAKTKMPPAVTSLLLVLLAGTLLVTTTDTYAAKPPQQVQDAALNPPEEPQLPNGALLEQLRERLLLPPSCAPQCATLSDIKIAIEPAQLRLTIEIASEAETGLPLPGSSTNSANAAKNNATVAWVPSSISFVGSNDMAAVRRGDDGNVWIRVPRGVSRIQMTGPLPERTTGIQAVEVALPMAPRHISNSSGTSSSWVLEGLNDDQQANSSLVLRRGGSSAAQQEPKNKDGGDKPATENNNTPTSTAGIKSFIGVERELVLGLNWTVHTRVVRLNESGAVVLRVPLLPGEKVTTAGVKQERGAVVVSLGSDQAVFEWDSSLAIAPTLNLEASSSDSPSDSHSQWWETWTISLSSMWHLNMQGMPAVQAFDSAGQQRWVFRPWPSEKLNLTIGKPTGIAGASVSLIESQTQVTTGSRSSEITATMKWRASRSADHVFTLPAKSELLEVTRDGAVMKLRQEGDKISLPLVSGEQTFVVKFRESRGGRFFFHTSEIKPGLTSTNGSLTLSSTGERWILLTGGDGYGPAILFWSQMLIIALGAFILGHLPFTPISKRQWFLLGLGLSQASLVSVAIVVGFLLALGIRGSAWRYLEGMKHKLLFNLVQLMLVVGALSALSATLDALHTGFIGRPDMQIVGNLSHGNQLNFFSDYLAEALPRAWLVSTPIIVYQGMMLLWALWFAFAIVKWARWGFECMSAGGLWQRLRKAA